jgi:K+ transporter
VESETNINRIQAANFSYLNRNALHDEEHYGVPINQVVEIGSQIRA